MMFIIRKLKHVVLLCTGSCCQIFIKQKKHEVPHYATFSSPLLLPPSQAQVLFLAPADPQTQDQHLTVSSNEFTSKYTSAGRKTWVCDVLQNK
jgi:hypothetical protein